MSPVKSNATVDRHGRGGEAAAIERV